MFHGYTLSDQNGWRDAFPFGHGLSYSSFKYSDLSLTVSNGTVQAKVNVENSSDTAGDEVVQFYVGFSRSTVQRPVKLLRGFQRTHIGAHEEKTVIISCDLDRLRWYNPETKDWELEIMEYEAFVGGTSDTNSDQVLSGTFVVELAKL